MVAFSMPLKAIVAMTVLIVLVVFLGPGAKNAFGNLGPLVDGALESAGIDILSMPRFTSLLLILPGGDCSVNAPGKCGVKLEWKGNKDASVSEENAHYDVTLRGSRYVKEPSNIITLPELDTCNAQTGREGSCGMPLSGGGYKVTVAMISDDETEEFDVGIKEAKFYTELYVEQYDREIDGCSTKQKLIDDDMGDTKEGDDYHCNVLQCKSMMIWNAVADAGYKKGSNWPCNAARAYLEAAFASRLDGSKGDCRVDWSAVPSHINVAGNMFDYTRCNTEEEKQTLQEAFDLLPTALVMNRFCNDQENPAADLSVMPQADLNKYTNEEVERWASCGNQVEGWLNSNKDLKKEGWERRGQFGVPEANAKESTLAAFKPFITKLEAGLALGPFLHPGTEIGVGWDVEGADVVGHYALGKDYARHARDGNFVFGWLDSSLTGNAYTISPVTPDLFGPYRFTLQVYNKNTGVLTHQRQKRLGLYDGAYVEQYSGSVDTYAVADGTHVTCSSKDCSVIEKKKEMLQKMLDVKTPPGFKYLTHWIDPDPKKMGGILVFWQFQKQHPASSCNPLDAAKPAGDKFAGCSAGDIEEMWRNLEFMEGIKRWVNDYDAVAGGAHPLEGVYSDYMNGVRTWNELRDMRTRLIGKLDVAGWTRFSAAPAVKQYIVGFKVESVGPAAGQVTLRWDMQNSDEIKKFVLYHASDIGASGVKDVVEIDYSSNAKLASGGTPSAPMLDKSVDHWLSPAGLSSKWHRFGLLALDADGRILDKKEVLVFL